MQVYLAVRAIIMLQIRWANNLDELRIRCLLFQRKWEECSNSWIFRIEMRIITTEAWSHRLISQLTSLMSDWGSSNRANETIHLQCQDNSKMALSILNSKTTILESMLILFRRSALLSIIWTIGFISKDSPSKYHQAPTIFYKWERQRRKQMLLIQWLTTLYSTSQVWMTFAIPITWPLEYKMIPLQTTWQIYS